MDSLADRVAACERCGLARTRRRAVAGDDVPGAAVLLIAAAPSFGGELVGHALSDEAREVLARAGVDVAATAATTLVKCRPPAGRAPTARTRSPPAGRTSRSRSRPSCRRP